MIEPSEYTPSMDVVRRAASDYRAPITPEEFDRWLAAHNAEARAEAWGEGWAAAGAWETAAPGTPYPWNPYRKEQG